MLPTLEPEKQPTEGSSGQQPYRIPSAKGPSPRDPLVPSSHKTGALKQERTQEPAWVPVPSVPRAS